MDLTTTKIPENGTPPKSRPNKSLTFSNGALKRHNYHHHHHLTPGPPPPPPLPLAAAVVTYKECLKNHAASIGGHAVDGCGEFMPSPTATPTDPTSLKCAACGCHRNFHRREPDDQHTKTTLATTTHFLEFRNHHHRPQSPPLGGASASPSPSPSASPPPPPLHYSSAPHMLLALSTALPDDPPAMTHHHPVSPPPPPTAAHRSGRKRFRTKFSREQKEKMLSMSEKLGWKMQKCDESLIENFCNEVGIGKSVLKVWMHNNKNTFGKRDTTTTINNNDYAKAGFDNTNGQNTNTDNSSQYHNDRESSGVPLNVSTDGSSSSS